MSGTLKPAEPIGRRPSVDFPPPWFPAGVGVPAATLLGTLLLSAAGLAMIQTDEPVGVLGGAPGRPGVIPGVALAAAAVGAWLALHCAVVTPVRNLRDDILAPDGGRRARRSVVPDVDRIAVSVREIVRPHPSWARQRPRGLPVPMTAVLVVVGVVVLGTLAGSYTVVARGHLHNVRLLVSETGQDTGRATDRLRSALLGGLSTLQGMTGPAAGGAAGFDATVSAVLATRPVFRAVYVLSPDGRQVAAAGAPPGRVRDVLPAPGISQLNTSGAEPVVVAAASLYDGNTLVGEYDPRALNDALRQSTAHLLVLDPGLRTVLSNRGYQAFSEILDPDLRTAAAVGLTPTAAIRTVDGSDAAVAARQVGIDGDPLAALGWVVLTNRDLGDGEFAHDPAERTAAVITGLGVGVVLALLGWTYIATVRPLRGAATHAAGIAAAQGGAALPAPVPAQRADEIGAIIAGLNRHLHTLNTASGVPLPRVPATPLLVSSAPDRRSARVDRSVTARGSSGWELDDRHPDTLDVDALAPSGE